MRKLESLEKVVSQLSDLTNNINLEGIIIN